MANTYKLIASSSVEADNSVTTITFSNIPQTYSDLLIKVSARGSQANYYDGLYLYFNQLYSSSYNSGTALWATTIGAAASAPGSSRETSSMFIPFSITGNQEGTSIFGNLEIYIPSYTTSIKKQVGAYGAGSRNSTALAGISAAAALWNATDAISLIEIVTTGGPYFMSGSDFKLYGIKNS